MKKGFGTVEIIIAAIVSFIVLGVLLWGLQGEAFGKVTKDSIAKKFFSEIEGEEGVIELSQIPPLHQESINLLKSTIEGMLKSPKSQCFANYGGFPDLGEGGTSLEMIFDPSEKSTEFVIGTFGGEQRVSSFKIKKMVPCVIAGESYITENFADSFLNTEPWAEKNIKSNHYKSVTGIKILYQNPTLGFKGNIIRVPSLGEGIVNDESNNFLDGGYLYKPDESTICFFPTVFGSSDEDGLDDNYLGQVPTEDVSLPRQVGDTLIQC